MNPLEQMELAVLRARDQLKIEGWQEESAAYRTMDALAKEIRVILGYNKPERRT